MKVHVAHAFLAEGWAKDVLIEIDDSGRISSATPGKPGSVPGFVVPGMPNLHSHAFQRAMAGFTQKRTHSRGREAPAGSNDSFWTWRELMYRFAARVTPEQMQDLAAYLYVEMLKGGYTSVAEFHYLHRDPAGAAYEDPAEMSHRLIAAAGEAGIAITHLPVLYAYGGFGSLPPNEGQRRFVLSASEYEALLAQLDQMYGETGNVRIGAAFHSLRAVDPKLLAATLVAIDGIDATSPIHIHIAEQKKEVEDCIAWSGKPPVKWLLDNARVDRRWCLVHATHVNEHELERLAASGAVAGLCPTTEADLGDGLFPAGGYRAHDGRYGIGSDSHVCVSAAEELRLLEYGQRLQERRRVVLDGLYENAAAGGASALGIDAGRIARGARADLVVLDPEHRAFWNQPPEGILDAWIYAGEAGCVRDVMVGGEWRIRDGRHPREEELARRFRAAQAKLLA